MSTGTARVTPRIVRSTSPLNALSAVRSVKRPLKLILGWFSTSRKSALRRWASRAGSPVQIPVASISPSKVAPRQRSQSSSSRPWMFLNRPCTQVTIMCRARNSASVCPGSKIQVDITGDHEGDLVDVAPAPVLAGLRGMSDWMPAGGGVLARVPVRRAIAAADMTARLAPAQVQPSAAAREAVPASRDRLRELGELDAV